MILRKTWAVVAGLTLAGVISLAQYRGWRSAPPDLSNLPDWEIDKELPRDLFTFVRIQYDSNGYRRKWTTDWPDSDANFSFRLQQLTSLKVQPKGVILELTDPRLFDYPWIYIVEPGDLRFSDSEVGILRRYLLNGGFLMVDDFWGEREWWNFYREIRRVFPDRDLEEVPLSHPLFHCVFDIKVATKEELQCPNVWLGTQSQYNGGITWEREDAQEVHFRAIFDDKRRIMVMVCHNTDNGDGWEREGDNEYYFREFSEKKAYPLGINIVFYSMTH